jgi:hypothetical protein
MEKRVSFENYAIVACGALNLELNHLKESGLLDARIILYTRPGRHQIPSELESQLVRQLQVAKTYASNIIVVYGGKFCYVNIDEPRRTIDTIIQEQVEPGITISRIKASHCIDMLMSEADREQAGQGRDIYWTTPGWMKYRQDVYQGWDKGTANENFPKHTGGAVMLDGVGYFDDVMQNDPEAILDFSDWMGIPLEPNPVALDRLYNLLADEVEAREKVA